MTVDTETPVRVEVWSDPQCVWCYIGNPRLNKAVEQFAGAVEVVYRSFELHPEAPVDIDREEYIRQQSGMSAAQRERILSELNTLAVTEGLTYQPDLTLPTNSHRAFELLHHADVTGHRAVLGERLSTAYFAEGRHIGHLEDLLDLAAETGLDPHAAHLALTEHHYTNAVDQDTARARALGAGGVPFYLFNGAEVLSGTQTTQAISAALERASTRSRSNGPS